MNRAPTNQSAPPQGGPEEKVRSLEEFVKASINILEDFNLEKARSKEMQEATLNILGDFNDEGLNLRETQRATLNILEDFDTEKSAMKVATRATLNILEDFDTEKKNVEAASTLLKNEIVERKHAEETVRRTSLELKSTNKELEGFAYAVSHDLKAPLRGIDSLAGWIAEDFQDKLDEEGKKNLGMLQARVKKMHALIDGILEYSRIGRTREEIETIDLNQLLPGIIEFLSPPAHIQIEVQKKLPVVKAEKTRIHQVFQNLLSNAVKYTGKPQGKIKVGCETEAGFWRFNVSDNGPGIEEKYHELIFGLFQTLDSTETSENTGVGLSLVKKIVELYGGKAGVKSKPGQGSTFWFTFPKTYGTQRGENQ